MRHGARAAGGAAPAGPFKFLALCKEQAIAAIDVRSSANAPLSYEARDSPAHQARAGWGSTSTSKGYAWSYHTSGSKQQAAHAGWRGL